MNDSQSYRVSNNNSHMFYETPNEETESYFWAQIEDPNQIAQQPNHLLAKASDQYCTLESSSGTGSYTNPAHNSSPSVSFSPENESSQPEALSANQTEDDEEDLRHKLRELETAMLGADPFEPEPCQLSEQDWTEMMEMVSRADLKGLLCACARSLDSNDILRAEWLISELRQMVSVSGDPIQRLGAYVVEGLVARLASSGSAIYKALRCKEPEIGTELFSYMHLLYEVCPYFKFGYMSANGAIAEAVRDEPSIHIIDFQIVQGAQWMILIRALAGRPNGPPNVRITAIDDATSISARGGGLEIVGARLSKLAEMCKVPFEFNSVEARGPEVELHDLGLRPGEAVAMNFAMALHHIPDEGVGPENHRDRILRLAKLAGPRVVTVVEQEADTGFAPFLPRFVETIGYYLAVFESVEAALPRRDHRERIGVEQHCLARDVVNLIACEGAERVERHEPHSRWRARMSRAGFRPSPLSQLVNSAIEALLGDYCDKYSLEERDGALFLGWLGKPLCVSSAWR